MNLFTEEINNWNDWGNVFQSIPAFTPLVEYIFQKEKIATEEIKNLTPGTNAVFQVGKYVIKIFAPSESGIDQSLDLQTELFAVKRVNKLGISAPRLIVDGCIEDKYRFAYMITEYIKGVELVEAVKSMNDAEKINIARKLRDITDIMNTPCEPFNGIDVINDKGRYCRWDNYSNELKTERLTYIKSCDYGELVFVHGDLCLDNMILTPHGELYIIDFADAVLAPKIYEHALMPYSFEFDPFLIRGYFSNYSKNELIQMCFNGLLIHDFGGDIIKDIIGKVNEFNNLDELKRKLNEKMESVIL